LGLGKKVYLNPETSQWNLFQNLGINVYSINGGIDLNINAKELKNNKKIVREWFSLENLIKQWQEIFNG
jgi:dTDP-N-acetylfucosamine:lipid II N-acetylfucosaminyltransferase